MRWHSDSNSEQVVVHTDVNKIMPADRQKKSKPNKIFDFSPRSWQYFTEIIISNVRMDDTIRTDDTFYKIHAPQRIKFDFVNFANLSFVEYPINHSEF
jgi:hypothetical protein